MRDPEQYDFDPDEIEYNPETRRFHLSFAPDWVASPSMVVVQLVSNIIETPIFSLPPFYSAVDAGSLDTWLSGIQGQQQEFQLEFSYAGCQITLDGAGNIWAQPIADEGDNIDDSDS